ncbi:MAG TPA: glucan biosynthesis protein G [Ideonella sp.]|uniref:glucan biosynthesis protein G n=1 Tax=Ideonella sp. TaxID=1929293 RepID=UPI002C16C973|nr:glucan biosynthesis protein G [Ideonella sp.]HSI47818.1 glucan biosynthesis protein G [Ideonella sp.]
MTTSANPSLPRIGRRRWQAAVLALPLALLAQAAAAAMDLDTLAEKARVLAAHPYQPTPGSTPQALKDLSYDEMRSIRFKPARAVWREQQLPFELMFFHLGKYQTEPVRLHELNGDSERNFRFQAADFSYDFKKTFDPAAWGDIGYAGFRVHTQMTPGATYKDELVVFQGASYFRALGAGQHYGLSARGLAVDTAGGLKGEEFPRFTDFWLQRPAADAKSLVVLALMDSPRVTGAYRFDITPGVTTQVSVHAKLVLRETREPIRALGIAPLTSMFSFGENQPHRSDFRPEVHDSDGLMMATGDGEWLWRPLQNPKSTLTTSFAMRSPKGFGLMQRDRNFSSYEDSEASYERRPSAWITPLGDWGTGRVELVQLHTPDETNDNIVAYWVPATLPAPGQVLDMAWRVDWQGEQQQRPPAGWVTQTRVGSSYATLKDNEHQLIVDFTGPALEKLAASAAEVPAGAKQAALRAVVSADGNGRIEEQTLYRVSANGAWRLALRVMTVDPTKPVELRAFLQSGNDTVSETWTHLLTAQ